LKKLADTLWKKPAFLTVKPEDSGQKIKPGIKSLSLRVPRKRSFRQFQRSICFVTTVAAFA